MALIKSYVSNGNVLHGSDIVDDATSFTISTPADPKLFTLHWISSIYNVCMSYNEDFSSSQLFIGYFDTRQGRPAGQGVSMVDFGSAYLGLTVTKSANGINIASTGDKLVNNVEVFYDIQY